MFVTDIPEHFLQGSGKNVFCESFKKLPCDLCCIMALECALQIKISVFKLRTLLGERTPTITVGEVFLEELQRIYPVIFAASWLWNAPFELKQVFLNCTLCLGRRPPKKSQRREKIFQKLIAGH